MTQRSELDDLRTARNRARDRANALWEVIGESDPVAARRYHYLRSTLSGNTDVEDYGLDPREYAPDERGCLAYQAEWWRRRGDYLQRRLDSDRGRRLELAGIAERRTAWAALADEVADNTRDDPESRTELRADWRAEGERLHEERVQRTADPVVQRAREREQQ